MPIPTEARDLRAGPARDDVRALLERMIVVGELAPGARVTDAELLGISQSSRAPLREALNELAQVGLVEVRPRRSTEVTAIDPRISLDALQIDGAVIRQSIEEAVPRLSAAERDELGAAATALCGDLARFRSAIRAREHRMVLDRIVALPGNPEYARVVAQVAPLVDRHAALHASDIDDTARARFRAMLEAAAAGDPSAATMWESFEASLPAAVFDSRREPSPLLGDPPTLRDKAAAVIEQEIYAGTLVPGERLREADLMRWLGISRTPIREALTTLARKGLVELTHQRTAKVASLDAETTTQVVRALAVLRSLEIRLALQREPAALAQALETARPEWLAPRTPHEAVESAVKLMGPVNDLCGNGTLVALAGTLGARVSWAARHDSGVLEPASIAALREIHAALVAGNPDAAQDAIWRLYTGATSAG